MTKTGDDYPDLTDYDAWGRIARTTQKTEEEARVMRFAYDDNRYLKSTLAPTERETRYVNDPMRRAAGVIRPYDDDITYGYNATTGTLETIDTGDVTLSYTHDGFLLTGETVNGEVNAAVTQTFDDNFRITSRAIDNAHQVAFAYDDDGLLETAGDLEIYLDEATGRAVGTDLGNVATSRTTSRRFGELSSETYTVADEILYDTEYERDALGRIATKTETVQGDTTTYQYEYDEVGRLTAVYQDGDDTPTFEYTYDANGNRTNNNATYDDQDRLLSYGDNTYTYNENGDLLSKQTGDDKTDYTYDALGNLNTVKLPSGAVIDYLVDGRKRRIAKQINGATTQAFIYKDALNPIAELDENGAVTSRFVYGTKPNVPDYFTSNKEDNATWNTYRIVSDHLGSPRLIVNVDTGEVVQRMDYDAFGRVLEDTNPGFQPFGFAGGLYDSDTGLVRFGARDYDAEVGRWTAKDPIGFGGGQANFYGYVMNDPVNCIDPRGLFEVTFGAAILGQDFSWTIYRDGSWAPDTNGTYSISPTTTAGIGLSFVIDTPWTTEESVGKNISYGVGFGNHSGIGFDERGRFVANFGFSGGWLPLWITVPQAPYDLEDSFSGK